MFEQSLGDEISLERAGPRGCGKAEANALKEVESHLAMSHDLVMYHPGLKLEQKLFILRIILGSF